MSKTSEKVLANRLVSTLNPYIQPASVAGFESRIYIPSPDTKSQLGYLDIDGLNWREIPRHYVPSRGMDDWRKLHKPEQWRKGYSAYELAASWESADPFLPREIKEWFGDSAELLAVIPEHKTPLPGGSRPSQSDALAFIRCDGKIYAVAVEGKVHESFGPTVGEWLKDASKGKKKRLESIRKTLGLTEPPADTIRYQLLHRTASALIEAGRFHVDCAAMIVHSFACKQEPREDSELFDDFQSFLELFKISIEDRKPYTGAENGRPLYFAWVSPQR